MLSNIKRKQSGFTLVELLIVIVVIAILAMITIVAYNGIQNRAKTSAGQSQANSIVKKALAFNTINSAYPTYCQLVTNSITPTGSAPAGGTAGAGTCAAGGTAGGSESKLDNVSGIMPTANSGSNLTNTNVDGGKVVGYYLCDAATGANIYYWDYTVTTGNAKVIKAGTGC